MLLSYSEPALSKDALEMLYWAFPCTRPEITVFLT